MEFFTKLLLFLLGGVMLWYIALLISFVRWFFSPPIEGEETENE